MTSQTFDAIDLSEVGHSSPGADGEVYTFDTSSSTTLDGLNRVELSTGKVTHIRPAADLTVDKLSFFGAGRQFVAGYYNGFGWIDDDAQRVSVVSDNQSLNSDFLAVDANRGYFTTATGSYDKYRAHLWFTDGSAKGTKQVSGPSGSADLTFEGFVNGRAYMRSQASVTNRETVYSIAPGEKNARRDLDPVSRYGGDASLSKVVPLGDGVLANVYRSGADAPSEFCTIDATGKVKTLHLDDSLKSISIVSDQTYDDQPPGPAVDVIFIARTSKLGYQIYSIDGDGDHAVRRLSNFKRGTIDPNKLPYANVRAFSLGASRLGNAGDRRFLVSVGFSGSSNPTTPFDPTVPPQNATYLVDVERGSFTRVMDQTVTDAQVSSEGTFALASDHSAWRVGGDADATYPVAARTDGLLLNGDDLLMTDADSGAYRSLRDTDAIVYGNPFEDDDGDRKQDGTEWNSHAYDVFIDLNGDGKFTKHEPQSDGDDERFYFDGLRAGTYHVGFSDPDYASRTASVKVGHGADASPLSIPIEMTKATLYVRGFRDKDGDGVWDKNEHGVPVVVTDANDPSDPGAYGSADGFASRVRLKVGKRSLRIRWQKSDGTYQSIRRNVTLHAGINRITIAY